MLAAHMRDYHTPAYDVRKYAMGPRLDPRVASASHTLVLFTNTIHMHKPGLGGGADDGLHGRAHQVLPALQARCVHVRTTKASPSQT